MQEDLEKRATSRRRLLLAKQLYEHGLDHSRGGAALDKMIAVHNFHNAIEIALRAILLEHEIRGERELNLDFEALMNQIDQFPDFKVRGQRLPYRQELRKLNSLRNLVQHHAHEPEDSEMDEWRVFSRRFLARAFDEYFGEDFDSLTPVDLVADNRLRRLLLRSASDQERQDWGAGLCACKLALKYASASLGEHLPRGGFNSPFFVAGDLDLGLRRVVEKVYERIADAERYAVMLTSGVNAADFARYRRTPISVTLAIGGAPFFQHLQGVEIVADDVRWAYRFVVATIIRWQTAGLDPQVPECFAAGCDGFVGDQPPSANS
jgi:hypothetical protein